jgi:hypothetical protein
LGGLAPAKPSNSWNETDWNRVLSDVEVLVGLVVLVLFDIAAWRWGADSMPAFEEDLRRVTPTPRRAI